MSAPADVRAQEVGACLDIADVMRRRAVDLGPPHPWHAHLSRAAAQWEAVAEDRRAELRAPARPVRGRRHLQLVAGGLGR